MISNIRSVVSKEMKAFQSEVLVKFESKFVSAVESVMKDSSKVTDELLNINRRIAATNSSIQNLRKTYEQSISRPIKTPQSYRLHKSQQMIN